MLSNHDLTILCISLLIFSFTCILIYMCLVVFKIKRPHFVDLQIIDSTLKRNV